MRRALLVLVAACRSSSAPSSSTIEVADYATVPSHQLDVLLLIDNSGSTFAYQQSLGRAMPTLLASLAAIDGGTPSLHIGVATSDLGTSGSTDPAHPAPPIGQRGSGGCGDQGDDGALIVSGAPVTGTFLVDDGTTRNYTGTLAGALASMTEVGSGGCGFEQHLAGVRRALARPDNAAFLRPDANLLVLVIADEDDCSVANPALFSSDAALGPLQSFRCTAFGVTCNESLDEVGAKTGCHGSTDSPYIEDVATTVDFLGGLKAEPARVATAVIAGPPEPFDIEQIAPPGGGTPVLGLGSSCAWQVGGGTAVADPGVRLAELGGAFASRGVVTSVCSDDLSPQLREIGRVTKQLFGTVCLDTTRVDPSACIAEAVDASGTSTTIPFDVAPDASACPETDDHVRLTAQAPQAAGTHVRVSCTLR